MTYDAVERSRDGRRPVEIYTFARDYQQWRYTSADRDVVVDSQTYLARSIARGAIEATGEMARLGLTLTVQRDLEVADLFRIAPPVAAVTCTVRQYHDGDGSIATIWSGRIASVSWQGAAASIALEPVYSALRRVGLRRMYQRQCPHVLYGSACGVNSAAFRVDGPADAISGLTVSVSEASLLADGWFAGGFIEYDIALGIAERRFVTGHSGAVLTLSAAPAGLVVGQSVRMFPGCDHALATCNSKFSNAVNYGGMPYFTLKNPFGGEPIF